MDYLIRFVQIHENFRRPEIEALAALTQTDLELVVYSELSPYCIARLDDEAAAKAIINRSISSKGIYELWGSGTTYEELHKDVKRRSSSQWNQYSSSSFRFDFDTFQGTRSAAEQSQLIESFQYLNLHGPIKMKAPDQTFCIFEEYLQGNPTPSQIHFGRWIAASQRPAIWDYSLKRRNYISTTSMDSELALITANLTLAGPGKLFYDPFVGTGSFPIACAHFGAVALGSDIDGRMLRGKKGVNIRSNFRQYGLLNRYLDGFIADLTHCPLRAGRILDGIICDPPYGVREGLKVLGSRDGGGKKKEELVIDGKAAHLHETYIPPKQPYSFDAMLTDILAFAASSLVDGARLSLWMPTANNNKDDENDDDDEVGDEEDKDSEKIDIPTHPALELVGVCIQPFNKWSRRLLTYQRIPNPLSSTHNMPNPTTSPPTTSSKSSPQPLPLPFQSRPTANDLNSFRKKYFQGFKDPPSSSDSTTAST